MSANSELAAAEITDPALIAGYRQCRHLNAQHGRTYFLATLLLPPEKRPYVHALYGFARHVDDIVDEHAGDLDAYADRFLSELEWGATSDPVTRAVLDTIERWDIPHSYFADFVESMRMDLRVTSYATYDDLKSYMWGSAAVVGLQMLPILGRVSESMPWETLEPHAIDLGYAFQLTNFIRDVGEDLERGRIYLPQDSLAQFSVSVDHLQRAWRSGIVTDSLRNLLAFEIERARALYRSAQAGARAGASHLAGLLTHRADALRRDPRRDRIPRLQRLPRTGARRPSPSGDRRDQRSAGCSLSSEVEELARPSQTQSDNVTSTSANPKSRSSRGA